MTQLPQPTPGKKMGRPKKWSEDTVARFAEGTFDRIAAVMNREEDRTGFIREAVEREIQRREKLRGRRKQAE